ncbi:left-right determination factor 1-like [Branchiostoma floridae]|uniref:Left-right determination factor 1-like n=2 Tax=Branchiostoma floridae TaxID=7739 RepID=A0A9J7HTF0_BRAFL|nr:left-right determination factor 1-like [Branchiostoma floridae]
MKPVLVCALFSCVLASALAFSADHVRRALLDRLGGENFPTLTVSKRDVEVPAHIRAKYESMLKLHQALHQAPASRRRKREASLATLLRTVHKNPGIVGDVVYTETTRLTFHFNVAERLTEETVLKSAELRVFKRLPNFSHHKRLRAHPRAVNAARVSVYQVLATGEEGSANRLLDSRLIPVNGSGWEVFDVSAAVREWQVNPSGNHGLELWIEGAAPGRYPARVAKMVEFATQELPEENERRPELIMYTENSTDASGARNCEDLPSRSNRCCRSENYIDFTDLPFAEQFILEPRGYDAFQCGGGCPKRARWYMHNDPEQLQQTCGVVRTAPLPVMYLVSRGDKTEIEVADFPNMIVEQCACTQ